MAKFKTLFKYHRNKSGLKKVDISRKLDVSHVYPIKIESGDQIPSIERVGQLVNLFNLKGIPAVEFFRAAFREKNSEFSSYLASVKRVCEESGLPIIYGFLDDAEIKRYTGKGKLDWGGVETTNKYGDTLKLGHLGVLDRVLAKITEKIAAGKMTEEDAQKRLDQFFKLVETSWNQFEEMLDG